MNTVVDTALAPIRRQNLITALEWECLCTGRPNVLLEGPADVTDDLVRLLEPHLRGPVLWRPSPAPFVIPAGECGTFVLQNIGALARSEQTDLLRWLDDSHERPQVISTTACPLFPSVERGLFDGTLYYRLNVMLLCMSPGDRPAGRPG